VACLKGIFEKSSAGIACIQGKIITLSAMMSDEFGGNGGNQDAQPVERKACR